MIDAAVIASDFTKHRVENTYANPAHWNRVKFEPCLGRLMEMHK